jgi:hypothetical protein
MNQNILINKVLEFENWFDRIVEKENNLEVPIQVCFGLIEEHNNSDDKEIIIEKKSINKSNNNLSLWKMKIQTTLS